ncbi:NAD(P)/FAD-dependent oxidoreductase [Salipiger abyssi]|uniref:Putative dehydrogenase n=1 Tax=Salipiger abyssi TaxID=1250539 RepID=A0A1P8UMN0_9RHOB|nr:NAD(P)/FAD-dependent oxidoreductase [Salipiger abyssi]APZ50630.1 putative dehydrogenase [Salipiger abyssi]
MDKVDIIIAGAGVIGLATARALAQRGAEVLILEPEPAFGTGTSSRNSEVIHAGIYYPPGSLKARLCVEGRQRLYDYAARYDIPHRRCGKLIVATSDEQVSALHDIRARAEAAGVHDLRLLDAGAAQEMEPQLACKAALLSPSTGIVDSHALMLSLLGQAEQAGALLSLGSRVTGVAVTGEGFEVTTEDTATGETFTMGARQVVNAAGLHASVLAARIEGLAPEHVPQTLYARGNYYGLPGRPAFSHLIYPVPEPGGLGVHLTLDLAGGMRFGPDVEWIEQVDYSVNGARRAHFETEIRKYWPALPRDALAPTYCGIRPKLSGPGDPAADFRIDGPARHGVGGLVNLFGIESPGLTASLAIAEEVAGMLRPA